MKKTFKELREIDYMIAALYKKNEGLENTKFGYAYKKFADKNFMPLYKKFEDEMGSVRINNALEDKDTGAILQDNTNIRGFKFSKEGLKKCIEQENKIIEEFDEKEVEIEPYIAPSIPDVVSDDQKELLKGLLCE